jgi:hypothetical protein
MAAGAAVGVVATIAGTVAAITGAGAGAVIAAGGVMAGGAGVWANTGADTSMKNRKTSLGMEKFLSVLGCCFTATTKLSSKK